MTTGSPAPGGEVPSQTPGDPSSHADSRGATAQPSTGAQLIAIPGEERVEGGGGHLQHGPTSKLSDQTANQRRQTDKATVNQHEGAGVVAN